MSATPVVPPSPTSADQADPGGVWAPLRRRFPVGLRGLTWATTGALIVSMLIMVTGSLVRTTGSGLGCSEWPKCTEDSVWTTPEMGIHGAIEFGNRMITWLLVIMVAWVIIAANLQRRPDRTVTRLGWAMFWLVVLNAVLGGVTVWTGLNPYIVAVHFLAATAMLTAAVLAWNRTRVIVHGPPAPVSARASKLARLLLGATVVLVVAGTVDTGTGPHTGDDGEIMRMPLDWLTVTWVHGLIAGAVLVIAVVLWGALGPEETTARFRVGVFLAVLLGQGAVGVSQSLLGLPAGLINLHILGAVLVWVGAMRLVLDTPAAAPAPAGTAPVAAP